MYILGINAYHGDAAAALVKDGELIAAVEEERFNRVKHCAGFPREAIEYCLDRAGISIAEVEHIGISRNPAARLHKKIVAAGQRLISRTPAVVTAAAAAASHNDPNEISQRAEPCANGNGKNHLPIAKLLKERLRNAARIFDLKREVANA